MRPLLHGDIATAARALKLVPASLRRAACRGWIAQAERADHHVRMTGRLHRAWGNGSLMSVAQALPLVPEPTFEDLDYCRCMVAALETVIEHHQRAAHSDRE